MKQNNIQIFIADEFHESVINLLKQKGFAVIYKKGLSNNELLKYISAYDKNEVVLIFRSVRKINSAFIDKLVSNTKVKMICTASAGYDNIDVLYAQKRGLKVFTVPDGNYISAAEHTIGMLLAAIKHINKADYEMKLRIYDYKRYENHELLNKTIGIIGVGRVGSYVAKICRAFDMKIIGNDINKKLKGKYKWIKFVPLSKLLKESDIVSVHTPLDSSTKYLLNKNNLKLLKKTSILINCARGGIIDENVLIEILKSRKIKYACLDVFINEPNINKGLLGLDNVILTPHLAGKTKESKERIAVNLAGQIIDYYSR
jgi:D-3-phosphoglycerate dehydrogenase